MRKPELDKEQRTALISSYRELIEALQQDQNRLFKRVCDRLDIKEHSDRGTTLFDFLFNGGFGAVKTPAQLEKVLWPKVPSECVA